MSENTKAQTPREDDPGYRSVEVQRLGKTRYRATNSSGDSVEFGQGEGLVSPVELLLAAIAGCSAVDVDVVTSRRAEPEEFRVVSSGIKYKDDEGGSRLRDVELAFTVKFPEGEVGEKAASMVPRLVELARTKDCTVSRTVEHETDVSMRVED
ncbi:OsmC family protein [Rothia uropygioeca]|uniref:OsmC family protein n=1 Tax=Kocuria sp. 257 TaxID=2021970 RepID=UPI001010472A|nr:OsmC family protein [Kocuria sp. 257]